MYDINKIRKDFPMLRGVQMQNKPLVFLDNASTTFKPNCVIEAINEYYTTMTSNSHRGDYDLCYMVDKKIDETREKIAKFVNSDKNEVVFTSGTTMSINMIADGFAKKILQPNDEIILDVAEHASNVLPWFKIAKETGAVIKYVDLDDEGKITLENLKQILNKKTKIVALAGVSNVLGFTLDLKKFAKIIHEFGSYFIVDGAQYVPHIKTDFKNFDLDFISFSAHKMCGPTGIGCFVGKYKLLEMMDSPYLGGGMNVSFSKDSCFTVLNPPQKFEAGTLNIEGIFGFGAAIDYINSIGIDNIHEHDVELHNHLIEKLKNNDKVIIYNKNSNGGIFTFNIKDVFAQDEATLLNSKGIAVRSGQHCAKILNDFLKTNATVRVSTYLYTSIKEIDYFIEEILNGGDILDAYFN